MANTLTDVIPQLLAQGLLALREAAFVPRIVNRGYERLAGERGSTIDVPVSSAIAVQDVTPAATPPSTADIAPSKVAITLDKWKEAPFYLTDKEILEVMAGTIPMQAAEAVKALANQINTDILALYKDVYGYAGTAATTPFGTDLTAATALRKVLGVQLAPMDPRYIILDPEAEANALNLRALQDQSWRSNPSAIVNGQIGRTLGFDWFMHQLVPSHTAGTASGATTNTAGYAAGVKTVTLASAGTGTILVGDVFTLAGHSQTYVVTSGDADVSNGGTISFEPGLKVALAASAIAITLKATHRVNLGFHRDAFAFATRPLENSGQGLGTFMSAADPESGLTLRLELSREHKRTRWSFDVLYGVKTVRRELACRLAG